VFFLDFEHQHINEYKFDNSQPQAVAVMETQPEAAPVVQ
jgi:hypothetical protein